MAARSVLGLQHLRASFLDHVPAAEDRQAETRDRTRGVTSAHAFTLTKCIFMSRYHLDDDVDDDDFDEDQDEDDEADGDDEDEEDDDDEVETWQV
jgi:hypothetical protein